jgi:hypothetical protein
MCKLWYYKLQVMRTLKPSSLGNWWKTTEVFIFGHPIAYHCSQIWPSPLVDHSGHNIQTTQEHLLRNTSRTSGTCCKPIGNLMGTQWELHGNQKKKPGPSLAARLFFWSTSVLCHRSPDFPLSMLGLGMN